MSTIFRHVHELPRPPRELVPDLSPELSAIILKALAKRPEDRQQGADELWEELLAVLPRLWVKSGHRPSARPPAPVAVHRCEPTTWALPPLVKGSDTSRGRVLPSRSRRRMPLWVALAAAASSAIALLGWAESRPAFAEQGAVSSTAP